MEIVHCIQLFGKSRRDAQECDRIWNYRIYRFKVKERYLNCIHLKVIYVKIAIETFFYKLDQPYTTNSIEN